MCKTFRTIYTKKKKTYSHVVKKVDAYKYKLIYFAAAKALKGWLNIIFRLVVLLRLHQFVSIVLSKLKDIHYS